MQMLTNCFPTLLLTCLGLLLLLGGAYCEGLGQVNNRRIDLTRAITLCRYTFHERQSEQRFLHKGRLLRRIEFNAHAVHTRLEGVLWAMQIILYRELWSKLQSKAPIHDQSFFDFDRAATHP